MWTAAFWKAAFERAIKTAAQAILTVWVVGEQMINALELDWELAGGVALGGFLVSIVTSVASGAITSTPGPSLTSAEQVVTVNASASVTKPSGT